MKKDDIQKIKVTLLCLAWAAQILFIYVKLMHLCSRLRHQRLPEQSPFQFLLSIEHLFPGAIDEVVLVTHAYLLIKQGELPKSREEVQVVEQAWNKLNEVGVAALKEARKRRATYKRMRTGF